MKKQEIDSVYQKMTKFVNSHKELEFYDHTTDLGKVLTGQNGAESTILKIFKGDKAVGFSVMVTEIFPGGKYHDYILNVVLDHSEINGCDMELFDFVFDRFVKEYES